VCSQFILGLLAGPEGPEQLPWQLAVYIYTVSVLNCQHNLKIWTPVEFDGIINMMEM
jgi:hypothetical protein